jgi:Tol biopolymer transport system component/DNA-binding winged helix-turn-helix (wHTH) protein
MAPSPPAPRRARFSVFEVDRSASQLLKGGRPIKLALQPFKVLMLLLDRRGQVVSRGEIQRHLWGESTFVDFERGINFAINQIRAALCDDAEKPRYIETLPKRGYRFVAEVTDCVEAEPAVNAARAVAPRHIQAVPKGDYRLIASVRFDHSPAGAIDAPVPLSPSPGTATKPIGTWWWLTAGALLLAGVVSLATWLRVAQPRPLPTSTAGPPMRVVQLTTLTGDEGWATFSPDGEQVAFTWAGEKHDSWDIFVTLVGSSDVRRLTTDPLIDWYPAWSPDGRQIAFLRDENVNDQWTVTRSGNTTIQLVSALGGPSGKLSDFQGADSLSWSPDGRWLAVGRSESVAGQPAGIYLIPVDGGDPRLLIAPTAGHKLWQPAFSPDGRRLAYVSCTGSLGVTWPPSATGNCDLYLADVDGQTNPIGLPQRLTTQRSSELDGVTWTRDGTAVVYSVTGHLWRVGVDGTRAPERLEIAGANALSSATTLARDRLAFTRESIDRDIYRGEGGRPAQLLVGSTSPESEPRLSPDGRQLAFESARVGGEWPHIWVSEADGSNPRQLTHGPGGAGSPSWSPDGRQIAFDSLRQDGHWHIWMIDADGGTPRRITTKADNEHVPMWSRDGRWIYFSSYEGPMRDIWRVLASGGTPERMTHSGSGPFACESADGTSLLFQAQDNDSPLMMMALTGGQPRQLVACVNNSAFGVGLEGVYYVPCDTGVDPPVHVLDPKTGRDRRFGTLNNLAHRPLGLSVSPDGRTIVYPRLTYRNSDLMLIENFR